MARKSRKTLGEILADPENLDAFLYARGSEGLSKNTIVAYRTSVRQFQDAIRASGRTIRTPGDVRSMIVWWFRENAWSGATAQAKWYAVKEYCRDLQLVGAIDVNPLYGVRGPKAGKKAPQYLSAARIAEMLDMLLLEEWVALHWRDPDHWIRLRNVALIDLLYATGCRISEVLNLNLDDYNPGQHEIVVTGKGNKRRIVYLCPRTVDLLDTWLICPAPPAIVEPWPLFTTKGGRRLTRDWVFRLVRRAGEAAGIRGLHPHSLRHACATHLLEGGAGIAEIQMLLGHESINTTAQYVEFSPQRLLEAHRKYHPRGDFGDPDDQDRQDDAEKNAKRKE